MCFGSSSVSPDFLFQYLQNYKLAMQKQRESSWGKSEVFEHLPEYLKFSGSQERTSSNLFFWHQKPTKSLHTGKKLHFLSFLLISGQIKKKNLKEQTKLHNQKKRPTKKTQTFNSRQYLPPHLLLITVI